MTLSRRLLTTSLSLLLPCLFLGLLPACGSGGAESSGTEATSGFLLKNNGLTFGGVANTHVIVGYSCRKSGTSETITSPPLNMAPGDVRFVPLPTGRYTLSVVYDDGHTERLQVPPDQVDALIEDVTTVLFLY
jgi:hypothetical protein